MNDDEDYVLSAEDIAAAERLVDRVIADHVGRHVANFIGGSQQSEFQPSLDQQLPNGKRLGDCTKRDLMILGHAYSVAAERIEFGNPTKPSKPARPPRRRPKK